MVIHWRSILISYVLLAPVLHIVISIVSQDFDGKRKYTMYAQFSVSHGNNGWRNARNLKTSTITRVQPSTFWCHLRVRRVWVTDLRQGFDNRLQNLTVLTVSWQLGPSQQLRRRVVPRHRKSRVLVRFPINTNPCCMQIQSWSECLTIDNKVLLCYNAFFFKTLPGFKSKMSRPVTESFMKHDPEVEIFYSDRYF